MLKRIGQVAELPREMVLFIFSAIAVVVMLILIRLADRNLK